MYGAATPLLTKMQICRIAPGKRQKPRRSASRAGCREGRSRGKNTVPDRHFRPVKRTEQPGIREALPAGPLAGLGVVVSPVQASEGLTADCYFAPAGAGGKPADAPGKRRASLVWNAPRAGCSIPRTLSGPPPFTPERRRQPGKRLEAAAPFSSISRVPGRAGSFLRVRQRTVEAEHLRRGS